MRTITIIAGALFTAAGVFLMANSGLTFMSVAFIVGIIFVVAGVVECLSYSSHRGDKEEKTWILIDGAITIILGALILMNKLAAEAAVPLVLGMWVLSTGIRNFVNAWEHIENRETGFYEHLIIGLLNVILGLYGFFNQNMFAVSTIVLVGIYMVASGINLINVGTTIVIRKPDFLKTKEEKLEEAAIQAAEAHEAVKEAVAKARVARAELKVIEEAPEEEIDMAEAPKPAMALPTMPELPKLPKMETPVEASEEEAATEQSEADVEEGK